MATCTDWLMYLLWNYLLCWTPRASRGPEIRWGYANTRLPRFEGGIMPSMLNAEKVMTPGIRQKFFASLNECTRFANQNGFMPSLGVVMRPERPSFGWFIMVIGAIDANLGRQIVLQDCGWAALAGFCLTWRLKAERRLQPVTNAL